MKGLNIKKHMKKNRWNYVSLAAEMGVTRQTIANWNDGKTEPTSSQLVQLSVLLGVSIEELQRGDFNVPV